MSDVQNPRRGVLYKRMIGVCCCKFVVRFAWEAQESARAGARILISLFFSVSVSICCCSGSELVGRTDGTMWDVKTNLTSSAISACSYLELFYRFSQGDKSSYYLFLLFKACFTPKSSASLSLGWPCWTGLATRLLK